MGWLFGRKKKVPKVPFPEGYPTDLNTLKFPEAYSDKIIEPESVKAAAGISRKEMRADEVSSEEMPEENSFQEEVAVSSRSTPEEIISVGEPLFVKVDVYQRILGELSSLHEQIGRLDETNKKLDGSEYNEEANFDKLRKIMKLMHDRLLQADKVLFKL